MKKFLLFCLLCMAYASCKHHPEKHQADQLLFPPPVVQADDKISEKEVPKMQEVELADPGPKDHKGDPAIRIDEPVGNADTRDYHRSSGNAAQDFSKKIIKQGDISFETVDIIQTRKTIIASLKRSGGYIAEENESNNGDEGRKEYVLKARIPADNFDNFLNDVSSAAVQIDSKNISTRDVTTQFIDVATRLQNRKLLEDRYLALLKRASQMGDILKVENKLSQIRSEIESEQAQLNYMSKQVDYSSLDITFYTRHIPAVDKGYGAGYKFVNALAQGWDTLAGWFFGLVSLWPLLVIVAVMMVFVKRWRKGRAIQPV